MARSVPLPFPPHTSGSRNKEGIGLVFLSFPEISTLFCRCADADLAGIVAFRTILFQYGFPYLENSR